MNLLATPLNYQLYYCVNLHHQSKSLFNGRWGDELLEDIIGIYCNPKIWNFFKFVPFQFRSLISLAASNKISIILIKKFLGLYDQRFINMPYIDQKIHSILKSMKSKS